MTVSPRWTPDARPATADGQRRGEPRPAGSAALPPTLFQLPNLNPNPNSQRDTDSVPAVPSVEASAADTVTAPPPSGTAGFGTTNSVNVTHPECARPSGPSAPADEPGGDQDSKLPAQAPFPELRHLNTDGPAGRSWMEMVQQHGVVVVLLIIVVSTALLTGGDNEPHSQQVADALQITDADDTLSPGLPIAPHTHDAESGVASLPTVAATATTADIPYPEVTSAEPHPSPSASSAAIASLAPPESSPGTQPAASEPIDEAAIPAIDVATRTVSAREDDSQEQAATDTPSLETLLQKLTQEESVAGEPAETPTATTGPVPSSTPAGISDWTKYLPSLQPAQPNE